MRKITDSILAKWKRDVEEQKDIHKAEITELRQENVKTEEKLE